MAKRQTSKQPAPKRPASKRQTTKRAPRPKKAGLDEPVIPAPDLPASQSYTQADFKAEVPAATAAMEPEQEEDAGTAGSGRVTLFSFTFVGILLGVALGYYIGSETTRVDPPVAASQTTTEPAAIDADRTRKVLVLIQEELVKNARILRQQRELRGRGGVDLSVSSQIVKNDIWRAITSSSDAKALQDTVLLHSVATAYGFVDEVGLLQRKAVEAMSFGGKPAASSETERALLATLARISVAAEKSLVDAAVQIDHKLNAKE